MHFSRMSICTREFNGTWFDNTINGGYNWKQGM